MAIDDLFQPLAIRSLTVPNRFAMAPMTRQASPGGIPGADVAEYYRRRAAGGVGLIITEGIQLPDPAAGYPNAIPTLAGEDVLAGWTRVADAVHGEGATIAAQLWHQGAQRDNADGVVPLSPSGIDGLGKPKGRALGLRNSNGSPSCMGGAQPPRETSASTPSKYTVPTATCSTNSSGKERICALTATADR